MNSYEEPNNRGIGNFDYNTYNPTYNYDQPYGYNNIQSQNNYQYNQPDYSFDRSSTDTGTPPEPFNYYNQLNYSNSENELKTSFVEPPFEPNAEPPFEPKAEPPFEPNTEGPFELKSEPTFEPKAEPAFNRNTFYDPLSQQHSVEEHKLEEREILLYFDNDPSDEFRPPPVKSKSLNPKPVVVNKNQIKINKVISNGEILLDDDPGDEFKLPKNAIDVKPNKLIVKQISEEKLENPIILNEDTMSDLDENEIENDAYTPGLEWNRFKPIRPKSASSDTDKDSSKKEVNFKATEGKPRKISSPKLIGKPTEEKLSPKNLEVKLGSLETKSILKNRAENLSPTLISKSLDVKSNDLIHRKIKSPKLVSKKKVSAEIMAKLKSQEELDGMLPKNILKTRKLTSPKLNQDKKAFQPEIVTIEQLSPKLAKLITKSPILLKPISESASKTESASLDIKGSSLESTFKPIETDESELTLKPSSIVVKPSSPKSTFDAVNEPISKLGDVTELNTTLGAVNEQNNVTKHISVSPITIRVSDEKQKVFNIH